VFGQHLPALRGRSQRPVNRPHRALRIGIANRVTPVLLIHHDIANILELIGLLESHQTLTHGLDLRGRLKVHASHRILTLVSEQLRKRLRHVVIPQSLLHLIEEA